LRAGLEGGGSWLATHSQGPTADAGNIGAPLRLGSEQSPPTGGVERLVLEFTAFAPAPLSCSCSRAMRSRAAGGPTARVAERRTRDPHARAARVSLSRHRVHMVTACRRRYALIDYEP